VEGDFRLLGPIDLLQLLAQGGKTGVFQLLFRPSGPVEGEVYLEKGRPVHAHLGEKEGPEAFLEILLRKEGAFRFLLSVRASRTTLEAPLEAYLFRAVQLLDERVEVGPFDRLTPSPWAARATLDPETLALLLALKEADSPLDLSARTGLPLGEVLKRLGQLARLRLLSVSPRTPKTARLRLALGGKRPELEALLHEAWKAHFGPFRRVWVKAGERLFPLEVHPRPGLGVELFLPPEHLLFHGLRVGEEVLVWPEV
jgi:hypothetical protein